MQLHQIITDENDKTKIAYRDVSCFCGVLRGQCNCFSPKSHFVIVPRSIRDGMSPLGICPSTSAVQDNINSAKDKSNVAALEETGFVPLDLENRVMGVGINVVEQYVKKIKVDLPWDLPPMTLELGKENNPEMSNESGKDPCQPVDINEPLLIAAGKNSSSENDCSPTTNNDLNTKHCNSENETLKRRRLVKPKSCKSETKIAKVETTIKIYQPIIETPRNYQPKIETTHNIKTSERATPTELPMDLKDCKLQPFFCEQVVETIDISELPIITLQQHDEHLLTNKNGPLNDLYDQDGNNNSIQTAVKSKSLSGTPNDLVINNGSVTKSCKPEIDTLNSCKHKIKILEVKTYLPKRKKILHGNACNPVGNNVPSTERCKSKIQTKISIECQKCFTSISGPKRTCIICKKWYCNECVGQQIYPVS